MRRGDPPWSIPIANAHLDVGARELSVPEHPHHPVRSDDTRNPLIRLDEDRPSNKRPLEPLHRDARVGRHDRRRTIDVCPSATEVYSVLPPRALPTVVRSVPATYGVDLPKLARWDEASIVRPDAEGQAEEDDGSKDGDVEYSEWEGDGDEFEDGERDALCAREERAALPELLFRLDWLGRGEERSVLFDEGD